MQAIINGQNPNLNDTCTDCGSHADIGAFLGEGDTVLTLNFVGAQAQADAALVLEKAATRFENVQHQLTTTNDGVALTLEFSVTAEKMIFQMTL